MWTHLWSVTHEDDSNYIEGKSNNGGCYSEKTVEHFFINQYSEIRVLILHYSSSDFSYDELQGNHQNFNMASLKITNIEGGWDDIYTQTSDGEDEECFLEEIAFESSIQDALEARNSYIPPRHEDIIDSAKTVLLRGNLSEEEINNRLLKIKKHY